MSKMGYGYGSQWHLLRHLGYHREALDQAVRQATRGSIFRWLDFAFSPTGKSPDAEWQGLHFLPKHSPVRRSWPQFWPQTGNVPNWDAVCQLEFDGRREWLLVEAKAHVEELTTSCGAKAHGGLAQIRRAFAETKAAMRVPESADWLQPYYQYANRLATLHFLVREGVPSRLLFIYFLGDKVPGKHCPRRAVEWEAALRRMCEHLGLTGESGLEARTHGLFLRVRSRQ